MSIATRIVRIAAGSLPKPLRDRYREQWLADLRDAPEQGLRPAQIALGSMAFAVTVGRPLPKRRELTTAEADRRARIARALALSSAILALSQYASTVSGVAFGGTSVPDAPTFAMNSILITFVLLASALALVLVFATSGISARLRWAIVVFAVAGVSSIVQSSINSDVWVAWFPDPRALGIGYLAGAVLIAAGLVLVRGRRGDSAPRVRASIVAGAVVLLFAAATLANAVILWSLRAPLRFEEGPRTTSNPAWVWWLSMKTQWEALQTAVFVWCGVGAAVLVAMLILFAILGRRSSREIIRLALGAAALILIAGGGLLGFMQDGEFGVVPIAEIPLALWLGRLALVGAILFGVRATRTAGSASADVVGA